MENDDLKKVYLEAKPILMSIAYRMLGTRKDAEDIVHDVFIRLRETGLDKINHPMKWMTTVCTRRCLDFLKSAEQKKVDYVGPWLPEPLSEEYSDENYLEISASLSTAFVLLLKRLTPKERAVYLLREIFDQDYKDIAKALDFTESTCRKIYSRAKENIRTDTWRAEVSEHEQEKIYDSFKNAVISGDVEPLKALLAAEVKLTADGGGKVAALNRELQGESEVLQFISTNLRSFWKEANWRHAKVNGQLGIVLSSDKELHAVVTFGYDQAGKLSRILIMRNPEKLESFIRKDFITNSD